MTVHLFGKTDSPCIAAWTLKKTAKDHEHEFGKDVSQVIDKNFMLMIASSQYQHQIKQLS